MQTCTYVSVDRDARAVTASVVIPPRLAVCLVVGAVFGAAAGVTAYLITKR